MESKELFDLVKIVLQGIERTGDYALYSKDEKEQEAMKYLQENYPDLYYSLLGNLVVCSSTGAKLEIGMNKKGGIVFDIESRNVRKETYYPHLEKVNEKARALEDSEPSK